MVIKTEKLRRDVLEIFQAGLKAVAPGKAIKRCCRVHNNTLTVSNKAYDLDHFEKIIVLSAGKGAASMAKAVEELLGSRITKGMVCVKYNHIETLSTIGIMEAGHPVPDPNGYEAARALYRLAEEADQKSLVICLVSGGGSALIPLPAGGITLEDKQRTTQVLLSCGAAIPEINTIRKHLSAVKGGGLAKAVFPATLITLILSDVVGDDLNAIASGPCVPDPTTYGDCLHILDKYSIQQQIPQQVLHHLEKGATGRLPETPKAFDPIFSRTENMIVGSNYDALVNAKKKAEQLGYSPLLLSSTIEGETREVAATHMSIAREIFMHGEPVRRPACILSGGETTVTIRGNGKGGRNQEFVLAAARKMGGLKDTVVLSAGTDGTDGPTDAAGAICDPATVTRAAKAGLDPLKYLSHNDSYCFFDALGDLYKIGPTNTNVMDLRIIVVA